jgi:hypothetical protein
MIGVRVNLMRGVEAFQRVLIRGGIGNRADRAEFDFVQNGGVEGRVGILGHWASVSPLLAEHESDLAWRIMTPS